MLKHVVTTITFFPPRDSISIETNDERVFALADRLWSRSGDPPRTPIAIRIGVHPGPGPEPFAERAVVWHHGPHEYTVSLAGLMRVRIRLEDASIDAEVSEGVVEEIPALAARVLLEAPAAVLLSRRYFTVLHAAAVVGRRGAVVIRGASGAGKSTLTAAAWRAGFGVLADESLLVAHEDHDDLAACVRDLTLRPNAVRLLSLEETEAAFSGGEEKRRVDLFRGSVPAERRARRVATLLLGDREPGPARLSSLSGQEFQARFRQGKIPEERPGGGTDRVSDSWSKKNSFRLDGTIDLPGAIDLLKSILG